MAIRAVPPDTRARLTRRRRARSRAVAAALTVGGLACLGLGIRADPAPANTRSSAAEAPSLRTSIWSPRRAPALFADAVTIAGLRNQLAAVVGTTDACVAVNDDSGPLVDINATRPLAAASTQKLLVAAAALSVLGPTHRFTTTAASSSALHGGALAGDLFVVGGGDPLLTTAPDAAPPSTRLADLADAIVRAGVRQIDGALVADDSRYDRERAVPDWKPSETAEGDVGALGALVVDGGFEPGTGDPASDPALTTVRQLGQLLEARGVQISGGERSTGSTAPVSHTRVVASIESHPLAEIVEQMLTVSNNETAELLTRELGHALGGAGSTAAGTRAVQSALARLGDPVSGLELHDGSGLAPDDRVTCAALLRVIDLSARPRFAAIDRGLPVAGRTGTLASRFAGTPLAGRLRAKTGHIEGVVGLAGVIDAGATGVEPRFAFIADGPFSTDAGVDLQDRIATTVAAYADARAPTDLVPAPRRPG